MRWDQGASNHWSSPTRVKNYQKVVQERRDEVREYDFIEMTLRIALITVLLFIAALIEGVEQKGPFYIYGL